MPSRARKLRIDACLLISLARKSLMIELTGRGGMVNLSQIGGNGSQSCEASSECVVANIIINFSVILCCFGAESRSLFIDALYVIVYVYHICLADWYERLFKCRNIILNINLRACIRYSAKKSDRNKERNHYY